MSDAEKKQSFVNTSRKHYFLREEKQEQWMELNHEAAKTLARELNASPEKYLSYNPANDHGCLLYQRAMELRKQIDDKMGTGNYLVGKMRESEHHYSLFNEDEVLKDYLGLDIFTKYAQKIAQLYFPDEPESKKADDITAHGFTRENQIADTFYKIRLSKKHDSSTEYDNIILENPRWYDNALLIKNSIESLRTAYESQDMQSVLHNMAAAKRHYIIATPYCSGTSSVSDLVEKALFESKNIDYGAYKDNAISRDVLAFLCPDNDTYEKEYLKLCVKTPVFNEEKMVGAPHEQSPTYPDGQLYYAGKIKQNSPGISPA